MEINKTRGGKGQGSFGVPPHMQDQLNNMAKSKKQAAQPQEEMPEGQPEQADFMNDAPIDEGAPKQDAPATEEEINDVVEELTAESVAEQLGIEFDDEDFQKLLFKGYIEKEITVTEFKGNPFKATIKTLTSEEYEMVDEILTEELKDTSMSPKGYDARRSMMIGAFGITKILGKPICKEVTDKDGNPDRKGMAMERRKVLKPLAPPLINKIMEMHNGLTVATNLLIRNPGSYGKNS